MHTADWVLMAATVLGPILAVQAQKLVERLQSRQSQRENVFRALMASRGARLSTEHVAALNMIDLVFYGRGDGRRKSSDDSVIEAWRAYLDHLSLDYSKVSEIEMPALAIKREDLFSDLLYAIAQRVGYRFTKVQIRKGLYLPNAHEAMERQRQEVQSILPDILAGRRPLSIRVAQDPATSKAVADHENWQGEILKTLQQIRDGRTDS